MVLFSSCEQCFVCFDIGREQIVGTVIGSKGSCQYRMFLDDGRDHGWKKSRSSRGAGISMVNAVFDLLDSVLVMYGRYGEIVGSNTTISSGSSRSRSGSNVLDQVLANRDAILGANNLEFNRRPQIGGGMIKWRFDIGVHQSSSLEKVCRGGQ